MPEIETGPRATTRGRTWGISRVQRERIASGVLAGCALAVIAWMLGASGLGAEASQVPGLCKGRSDANVVLNAHAQNPKFILNVTTDEIGVPYGALILEQGTNRLYVDLFCRLWKHLPGETPGGDCEGELPHGTQVVSDGATIVHVVGLGTLRDGTAVIVRADARETAEGRFFRVRYKAMKAHDEHEGSIALTSADQDEDGCADETWTRVPAEGWAPLKLLKLRAVSNEQ